MTARVLERIVATTDVHSALDQVGPMLAHLHQARATSLVVDCGDFFEGTGYYRLGGGTIERQILLSLYDVLAPGNHGWTHHFEAGLREKTVCANAVDDATGKPLFRRLHLAEIGGRKVAVTAVIGPGAFNAIPFGQRAGHRVTDPVRALVELLLEHHHEADAWILLSHSGFEEDLHLADACPFLDVIFAGHCHSDYYAPEPVGNTLVVKGRELGAGYALTEPVGSGWAAHTCLFPTAGQAPEELKAITRQIDLLRERLNTPLGHVTDRWRGTVPGRRELLAEVAARLHTGLGAAAVILNETTLRPTQYPLGEVLHLADLLAIEPFGNQLLHAPLPEADAGDLPGLLARLTERAGPLVTAPDPLPAGIRTVLTTDYLAEAFLGGRTHQAGIPLGQAVRHVLADPLPDSDEGEPR
ncbi:metallophosphoesterase [Streptomyces sp. H10-C2]|uniref:metallophosphoesterase n=1 Tax=unclassified Streptomyces TaxID=2593676 RepID=UPI0024BA1DD4|nr:MULTISPECIES: metallophosphoesterase [unclassified Streptomyces]MDJ0340429.1 metallophosphoesterase [Streptomyces sp. PH10-H1]MDJ0368123.1 metallophosphoesterase [Streptomyces sp. H10-C2]